MRKIVLILVMLLLPVVIFAKNEVEATLKMKDGTTRTGIIKQPKKPNDKVLSFATGSDAKFEKIACADITTMIVKNDDGTTTEFDYLSCRNYVQVWKKGSKLGKLQVWLPVVVRGGAMTYYRIWYAEDGAMRFDGYMSRSTRAYLSFCKRANETYASEIARTDVKTAFSHMCGSIYFEDDPSIAAKIKSGEYTDDDLPEIVKRYNKTHK